MRIDVHAHYWAGAYIDLLVELGRTDLARVGRQVDDLAQRVAEMDSVGVDYQINSAIGINVEVPDPAGARRAARFINDVYAEAETRFDGRFASFGSVPLPHVDEAIAETDRCLGELGFAGIGLPCSVDGKAIDHPDFAPFWENLGRYDTVVYVHPAGTNSAGHPGLADWGLHTAFGSPMQTAVAAIRLSYSGISTRYPNLQFVFALCGGVLPYLWKRHERNLRRGIERTAIAASGPNMFSYLDDITLDRDDPMGPLRRFWYDTSTQDMPLALLEAKESYGADRLVLGSDVIFASLTEAVHYVQGSPYLTDAEKTAILDTNAQSFLHLPERTARR